MSREVYISVISVERKDTNFSVSFHAKVGNALDYRCAGVVDAIKHGLVEAISIDYAVNRAQLTFSWIILTAFEVYDVQNW